jgi:4-carboxymuconolactone decarboxylase
VWVFKLAWPKTEAAPHEDGSSQLFFVSTIFFLVGVMSMKRSPCRTFINPLLASLLMAPLLWAQSAAAQDSTATRLSRGNAVISKLSGGAGQPVLNAMKQDFPFLAEAITAYSLGDVWSRSVLDDRTRQLATVAAFAAQGNLATLKVHAGYALQLGVTHDELKEIVYLTTVIAGFPRAIDAAQALREVFAAQSAVPAAQQPAAVSPPLVAPSR